MVLGILREDSLFLTQVLFSAVAISFSITMLVIGRDASVYLPILTGTLGYWVPNPQSSQQQRRQLEGDVAVQWRKNAAADPHPALLQQPPPPHPLVTITTAPPAPEPLPPASSPTV